MSKKLAFVLPDMRGGGAERVALRLIEDFVRAGHEVQLVVMEACGELMPLLPAQVRVFDLGAKRIRDVPVRLTRYLRAQKPDAIHVAMWPLPVAGVLAHRLARSRARLVLIDPSPLSRQYADLAGLRLAALKSSIRLFYPRADARIAVSVQAADDLAALSGIDRASIEVIYNPVGAPPADADRSEAERLWGGARGRIVTVGSLKPEKNHALLIRAFARLRREREAKLMIVGSGPVQPDLARIAEEEGVAGDVLMPGFFADPWPFYLTADLFVLSSDFEGYPLVMIEAMRAGLPVVSTDCESGPREILDGGRFGALVPRADAGALAEAMAQMLDHPTDGQALKDRAEALSGQATSDRHLQLMLGED